MDEVLRDDLEDVNKDEMADIEKDNAIKEPEAEDKADDEDQDVKDADEGTRSSPNDTEEAKMP